MLYHGTSNTNTQSIMSKGLMPRGRRQGNWAKPTQQKAHPKLVYLTTTEVQAEFYALRSAIIAGSDKYLTLVIDDSKLNKSLFFPDENLFTKPDGHGHVKKEKMAAAQRQILKNRERWKESQQQQGLVTYYSVIDPHKVVVSKVASITDNHYYNLLCKEHQTIDEFDLKFMAWLRIHALNNRLINKLYNERGLDERDYSLEMIDDTHVRLVPPLMVNEVWNV